jgi:hypothetical protein
VFAKKGAMPVLELSGAGASDILFQDLSSINRRIFTEYNGILYSSCEDSGDVDLIYASTDGESWAFIYDNLDANILSACSSKNGAISGAYFGDDTGKIIKITSPSGVSTALDAGSGKIVSICEYNGYLFALWCDDTKNKLFRSADGQNFAEVATNIGDLGLTGFFRSCTSYTDTSGNYYLAVSLDADVITSKDGITFSARKTFAYAGFEIKKLISFEGYLYLACGSNGIYRTNDFQKWYQVSDKVCQDLVLNTHLYGISSSGELYFSVNGTDFKSIKTLSPDEAYIGVFKGYLHLGDKRYNSYFFAVQSDVTFTGLYFYSDYLSYGLDASGYNIAIKHCTFEGLKTLTVKDASSADIENTKITGCYSGIHASGSLTLSECEFSCLDTFALYHEGNEIDINHITIFDALIGICIKNSVTGSIKNSIISGCHEYGIYSPYSVSLETSIYSSALMFNVIPISCKEANPLFCSTKKGALDLRIKTKSSGYVFPLSVAKGFAGDNKDAGCYDFSYSNTPRETLGFTFKSNPSEFSQTIDKPGYKSESALSGAPLITFDDVRLSFTLGFNSSQYITKETSSYVAYLMSASSTFWFIPQVLSGYDDNRGVCTISTSLINDLDKAIPILGRQDLQSEVTVISDTSKSWELNKWKGWHVEISGKYYRILFNDQSSLIIDGKISLPSSSYAIDRIKVALDLKSLQTQQLFYDGFLNKYPRNGFSLVFTEAD